MAAAIEERGAGVVHNGVEGVVASKVLTEEVTNETVPVGGRLRRFRNRWIFDRWATSIVSSGLGWEWLVDRLLRFQRFKQEEPALTQSAFLEHEEPSQGEHLFEVVSTNATKENRELVSKSG